MTERKTYYPKLNEYFDQFEFPRYPDWAHDFISIHRGTNPWRQEEYYRLMAPLALCRMQGSQRRPRFENKRFPTHEAARSYAERVIARLNVLEIHVVNCCESEVSA